MDTISIILVSVLAAGALILFILAVNYFIKNKRKHKHYESVENPIKILNKMRNEIDFRVGLHKEDEQLNEYCEKYPELRGLIKDYQETRNDYLGLEEGEDGSGTEN